MRSRHNRSREINAEINITAFMNLMVVLVPFLLITAVFSQMSVLELNLPPAQNQQPQEEPKLPLVLEVLIYENRFEVVDRQTGPLKVIKNVAGKHDYEGLRKFLKVVKEKFPDITAITLLLEQGTAYDQLIQTMDTVRLYSELEEGQETPTQYELFPDIAIGDAPPDTSAKSANLTSATEGGAAA